MWAQIVTMGIGLWLMVLPVVYQIPKNWSDHGHIIGPIIMSIGLIATSESTRNFRYANTALGAWLLVAPWILQHDAGWLILNEMGAGLLLIGFSLIRGKVESRFGGGWRSLWADTPEHIRATRSTSQN